MTVTSTNNKYELLRNKQIIAMLDGDTDFGKINKDDDEPITIAMPYLSGPVLCGISTTFGLPKSYDVPQSRWTYLDELIKHCSCNNRVSDLLGYLFSKSQFSNKLKGKTPAVIDEAHKIITEAIIQQINGILYFGGNELYVAGKQFLIRSIGETVKVEAPAVKQIDREYIKGLSERALNDINDSNFDSAITKARTLLEEVFCYVIEQKNDVPSEKGDIGKLYKQVKDLYNMHVDSSMDVRVKTLLSGLEKIVSSVAEMRNKASDSHGLGAKRINVADYHTRLFVNSATVMADFILSVSENNLKNSNSAV